MRSIEANYKKIQARSLNLGAYPCLARVVKGKKYSRKSLVKAFKELMPEDQYDKEEIKSLIDHLEIITNIAEEVEI